MTKKEIIRNYYANWEKKEWTAVEEMLADQFTFTSPNDDDHIDKRAFHAKRWSEADWVERFDLESVFESDHEAVVKYLCHTGSGTSFRNLEYFRFAGGRINAIECYFGGQHGYPSTSAANPQSGEYPRRTGRMNKISRNIASPSFELAFVLNPAWTVQAQDAKLTYPAMAPIEQYLMDRNAEIALARSAAPVAISRDAEVMILGQHGLSQDITCSYRSNDNSPEYPNFGNRGLVSPPSWKGGGAIGDEEEVIGE